jgi:hypothetical protein
VRQRNKYPSYLAELTTAIVYEFYSHSSHCLAIHFHKIHFNIITQLYIFTQLLGVEVSLFRKRRENNAEFFLFFSFPRRVCYQMKSQGLASQIGGGDLEALSIHGKILALLKRVLRNRHITQLGLDVLDSQQDSLLGSCEPSLRLS